MIKTKLSRVSSTYIIAFLLLLVPALFGSTFYLNTVARAAGTPSSPPISSPGGTQNKALSLTGGYVKVANSDNMNPIISPGFTAEAWIKPNTAAFQSYIFSKGVNSNSFNLFIHSESIGNNSYLVNYEFGVANSAQNCALSTLTQQKTLTAQEVMSWQHVAGVVQADGKLDIFVNGQRSTTNFGSVTGTCSSTEPVTIGARLFANSGTNGSFNGLIDNVRISYHGRYTENFIPTQPDNSTPTADGYDQVIYSFNQDDTSQAYNAVRNENNGILNGAVSFVVVDNTTPTPTPTMTLTPTPTVGITTYPTPTPVVVIKDKVGVYRSSNSTFYFRNTHTSGIADKTAAYGQSGDIPVIGDWDATGDGSDTMGVYRPSNKTFYLRNSNTSGYADLTVTVENDGTPVAGDFDGDGKDTVGTYKKGVFYLKKGTKTVSFAYGTTGDVPVIGDWNADGIDTVGVYRPSNSTFYLRNSNTAGVADIVVTYGINGDTPVVGDWNADGKDTVGVYRNGSFYLRNTNTTGSADTVFAFGTTGDKPVAGFWKN